MALIKCPDCGTDVSDAATACPKCARPIASAPVLGSYRAPASSSKSVSGVVGLLVLICLGFWIYSQSGEPVSEPETQTSAVSQPSSAEPVQQPAASASAAPPRSEQAAIVAITPQELFQKYNDNEVATDNALSGKIVQITAPVKSIDKDIMDSAVLEFSSGEEFSDVGVSLEDSEKAKAAQLSRGQVVTVQCKSMRRIINSPRGEHCVFLDTAIDAPNTASDNSTPAQSLSQANSAAAAPSKTEAPADAASAQQVAAQYGTQSAELEKVVSNTSGPSFDCSTVTNVTALAICGNDQLRILDRQMAILYYTKTDYANDPVARATQRDWIRNRNQSCVADVVCLTDQFNQRIQQLQSTQPTATGVEQSAVDSSASENYSAAIAHAVSSNWLRPDNLLAAPCDVDIVQMPGGQVVSAISTASCPYDDAGKRSVEVAILNSSPLPYKGFENVFRRHLTFTFRPSN